MKRRKLLAVLALLVGIGALIILVGHAFPGTMDFAMPSNRVFALVTLVASLIIVILVAVQLTLLRKSPETNSPPVRIIESRIHVTVSDNGGRLARVIKTQRFVAMRPNIRMILDHTLTADGPIKIRSFACDGLPVRVEPLEILPGQHTEIRFMFDEPPQAGKIYTRVLEYDLIDSFLLDEEYFAVKISRWTDRLLLIVALPSNRPARAVWLKYSEQATVLVIPAKDRIHQEPSEGAATELRYSADNPSVDSVHEIRWRW